MKNSFFISRDLEGPYKFLIDSSKLHYENSTKSKLPYYRYKSKRISFDCILFIILNIFNLNFFFKVKIMLLKYKNYNISRYAISEVYKNYDVYFNPVKFFFECVKRFYYCALTIETVINIKNNKVKAAFIDHGMYRNGLMIEYFSQKKIPIYCLGYPKGIFAIKSSNNKIFKYEEIIELKKSKFLDKKNVNKAKKSINKIIDKTELIPWMKSVKFKKIEVNSINKITHLIYTHAFTDAQLVYGYDGFKNVFEWTDFTIKFLLKEKKNRILIKAHPTFFHKKFPTKNALIDQKLFNKIYEKYQNDDRVIIFRYPTKNGDLLKGLNKKTILISHHGSAILEGLHLGFKCIASTRTFWSKNLKLTNQWNNIKEYKSNLKKNWSELYFCNKTDLYDVCYQLFCDKNSLYGKNYWQQIICDKTKIERKFLYENSAKIFHEIKIKKIIFDNIIQKISKTIHIKNFK